MKNFFLILLMILIVAGTGYGVYYQVENHNKKSEVNDIDEQVTTESVETEKYISGKIDLKSLCGTSECNKTIGNVLLNGNTYELSVNLNNTDTYQTTGTIKIGDKSLNVRSMDLIEETFIYGHIEGFEIYNNYFIVYLKSISNDNENYHGYRIQVYDENLTLISGMDGYTCGSFEDFKFENDILTYNAFSTYIDPNIYDAKSNINNYDTFNVVSTISIDDLVNKNYDNSKVVGYNYNCGTSQF